MRRPIEAKCQIDPAPSTLSGQTQESIERRRVQRRRAWKSASSEAWVGRAPVAAAENRRDRRPKRPTTSAIDDRRDRGSERPKTDAIDDRSDRRPKQAPERRKRPGAEDQRGRGPDHKESRFGGGMGGWADPMGPVRREPSRVGRAEWAETKNRVEGPS